MREKMLMKFKTVSQNNLQLLVMGLAVTLLGGLLFYFILHKPLTAAAEDYARQAAAHTQEITAVTNFQNAHLQMNGSSALGSICRSIWGRASLCCIWNGWPCIIKWNCRWSVRKKIFLQRITNVCPSKSELLAAILAC